jgi:glucose-6-phosphate isomerase
LKELKASGLPIYYDEAANGLIFKDGLTCAGSTEKAAGGMRGLLMDEGDLHEAEYYYTAYRDIVFERDRNSYAKYDFRYDITLIGPGAINGEKKKTSGHYHGYIAGKPYTYPEVYEVLYGTAVYILQRALNFDDENAEPAIDDILEVTVHEGQAIIIPPFYGHCSINAGEGPLMFSNIAVAECPLFYAPIKEKHGLAYYLTKDGEELKYVKNPQYKDISPLRHMKPRENEALGIKFGHPVYDSFVHNADKFNFLLDPEKYIDSIRDMIRDEG